MIAAVSFSPSTPTGTSLIHVAWVVATSTWQDNPSLASIGDALESPMSERATMLESLKNCILNFVSQKECCR